MSASAIGTLDIGDVLLLQEWPASADGTWYPVLRIGVDGALPPLPAYPVDVQGFEVVSGWVRVGSGDTWYVEPIPKRCPTVAPEMVDLGTVEAMLPFEWLSCFARRTIELAGVFGCPGCGGVVDGTFAPEWLAYPHQDYLSSDWRSRVGPLTIHFPPEGPARPRPGSILRVAGHFDDPAARDCRITLFATDDIPERELEPASAMSACRHRFVVESYEITGVEPDFGG